MIRGLVVREARSKDEEAVDALLREAFGGPGEARLVQELRRGGDRVLELVATHEGTLYGQIFFSRLRIETGDGSFDAVALAPLAVLAGRRGTGVGTCLIASAHHLLETMGEALSIVLGDPAYYGRFGYRRERAAGFESDYQGENLQGLAWRDAPGTGRLVYPPPFSAL